MINLIIADDQRLFLAALRMLLESEQDISILGEGRNGREVLDLIGHYQPDIVLTDVQMPEMNGIELTRALKQHYPAIAVIGMTMYEEDCQIIEMLEAGASGYLMKSTSREVLLEAIHAVHAKGRYFCESTSMKLMRRIGMSSIEVSPVKSNVAFTQVEMKIILLICGQLASKEIANQLDISLKTVESYRNRIFEKMGVVNMAGLVIYAIRHGYFDVYQGKPLTRAG